MIPASRFRPALTVWFFWAMSLALPAAAENGAPVPSGETGVLPVSVIPVEWVDRIEVRKTYTGQLEARRSSRLGFTVPGRLEAVEVREGDRVSRGDVLARVETDRLEAAQLQARANLARAKSELAEMEAGPRAEVIASSRAVVDELEVQVELQRLKADRRADLLESQTISKEEHDEAVLSLRALEARRASANQQLGELEAGTRPEQIEAQRAQVAALEAMLKRATIDLEDANLRAPYDAIILERLVDEGTVVEAGQPILEVLEAGALEARIGVPPDTAAGMEVGETLVLRAGDRSAEGTVAALLPRVSMETRTVTAILDVASPESGPPLRSGEVVRVEIPEEVALQGVWLPTTALVRGIRGLWACNVVVNDGADGGVIERREVELIHTEGERALVRGPLTEGERVVDIGNHRIVPGQRVRPVAAES